jgi:serine/threonine protein kinase
MEELSGKQLGQYRIVGLLGRGGMAEVYRAYQPGMDRYVAIKVLPHADTSDPNFLNRFRQEARVIAKLEHPNILPVYDYGEDAGYTYLVMRLVETGTLGDLLQGRPLPLDRIGKILNQVGAALDYAHARGVIHRDVKPSNVLIEESGNCLLTDFGIAKIVESTSQFTMTGNFVGTPQYASPEQGLGKELDGRSDIYSLGVILYEMATGRPPFDADTPMGLVVKHVHEPLPPPSSLNPALPPSVESVILKALEKDRLARYASASELVEAYNALLRQPAYGAPSQTVIETPETIVEIPPQPLADHRSTQIENSSRASPPPPVKPRAPRWIWISGGIGAVLLLCILGTVAASLAANFLPGQTATPTASPTLRPDAFPDLTATQEPTRPIPTPVPPIGSDTIYIEYILDSSGSMLELLQGKTRLSIAQEVLSERVAALPPDVHVGLRVYGHRVSYIGQEEESCKDIELVVPIQVGGAAGIVDWLPSMQALGMTPMSESIRQAAEDFTFEPGRNNSIILISDGLETCGDDPSDVARYLQELGINFTIHVIGLGVDAQTREQLSRLADTGKGVYHDANSEQDLRDALVDINEQAIQPAPEPTQAPTSVPTATAIPDANFDATSEGTVQASSTYPGYPATWGVDNNPGTSWFSQGSIVDGSTSTYTWTGAQDDWITSIVVISNAGNSDPSIRTGYGYDSVTVQVLDAAGAVVYEESVSLPGTPDPDVSIQPRVYGRSVVLLFSGHEAPDCGGFGELQIGVTR